MTDLLIQLIAALRQGDVEVVDLTQPLSERTPVLQLPPELQQLPPLRIHAGPRYGGQPDAWNWLKLPEHIGTHLDAPIHWFTGREGEDVAAIPAARLVAPAVVIDRTAAATADPDYLLGVDDVRAFEAEHGALPEGGWLLLRTGWGARAHDAEQFLGAGPDGPSTPGFDAACARFLAEETPLAGVGVETVGIDAGRAFMFEPAFPMHHHLLGAGKYGVSQLANLDRLPAIGAVLVVAPLRLVGGTGSPARVLALAPVAASERRDVHDRADCHARRIAAAAPRRARCTQALRRCPRLAGREPRPATARRGAHARRRERLGEVHDDRAAVGAGPPRCRLDRARRRARGLHAPARRAAAPDRHRHAGDDAGAGPLDRREHLPRPPAGPWARRDPLGRDESPRCAGARTACFTSIPRTRSAGSAPTSSSSSRSRALCRWTPAS